MMNEPIYFDEQHRHFRDNLRRFVEQEVVPNAAPWESEGMVPRALLRKMGELGYLGIRYDEKYGGSKLDTVYSAILA
jgi:acyl-CoA dehydrogenase